MTQSQTLLRIVRRSAASQPVSDGIETLFASHKSHWANWLAEYDGPGYYGRSTETIRSAGYIYEHLHCAAMLIWLAEVAGVERGLLLKAKAAVEPLPLSHPRAGRLARSILPWGLVLAHLQLKFRSAIYLT